MLALVAGAAIADQVWPHAPNPNLQRADPTGGWLIAAAVALSALSYILRPKPKVTRPPIDTTSPTLTTRGSYIPLLMGPHKGGPAVVAAGKRRTRNENGALVYYESVTHVPPAVGPLDRINQIWKQGKPILTTPIDRRTTPSGSTVQTSAGAIIVHWGEHDGPLDTVLSQPKAEAGLGILSRWPLIPRVHLLDWKVGYSPLWEDIQYDVEVRPAGSPLTQSPAYIEESAPGAMDGGVNPAHALYRVMTARYPIGRGMDPDLVDSTTLEAAGVIFANERLGIRFIAEGGEKAKDTIDSVFSECGMWMPLSRGRLAFQVIRPVDIETVPVLNDTMLAPPNVERGTQQGDLMSDRVTYLYPDRAKNWKPYPLPVDDDGEASESGNRNPNDITFRCMVDRAAALKTADRKSLEQMVTLDKITFNGGFTARNLDAGAPFIVPGHGLLRLVSKEFSSTGAGVKLDALKDQYGVEGSGVTIDETVPGVGSAAAADLQVKLLELPYELAGDDVRLGVMRIRGSSSAGSAEVLLSADGVSYSSVGLQAGYAFGGLLRTSIEEHSLAILDGDEAPEIIPFNADTVRALDLTGNNDDWFTGRQFLVVGDEVCFVRRLESVSGGYKLDGVVRERWGTRRARHPIGTPVYIMRREDLQPVDSALLVPGSRVFVKTRPDGVDVAGVVPSSVVLTGQALAPLPPDNVRPFEYTNAADVAISWTYRVREGGGSAAAERAFGVAVDTTPPEQEGTFTLRIYDGGVLVRTEAGLVDPVFTYTAAMQSTDGVAGDFDAEVVNVNGSYSSLPIRATVAAV